MAKYSVEEYVLAAMTSEERAKVSHSLTTVYRFFWIPYREKMYPKRTDHSYLHCPSYVDSAEELEISIKTRENDQG